MFSTLLLILFASVLVVWLGMAKSKRRPAELSKYKEVPVVEGGWPLIGHGISFGKDIIGFVTDCHKKYGNIFRVKIFKVEMIISCDRTMAKEFFKTTEDKLSLYEVLDRLFFSDGFSDEKRDFPIIFSIIKKTIGTRYDEFMPKIVSEAESMIGRMGKKTNGQHLKLSNEMIRFVASTSAKCFICIDLPDEIFDVLMQFTHLLNKVVPLTYFLPKFVLRLLFCRKLRSYRAQITSYLKPVIQSYRNDPSKSNSMVIRKSVDFKDEKTGVTLSDDQIGDLIVSLLYVSSENTALGLSAVVTDLVVNPSMWDRLRKECSSYLKGHDIKGLLASPLLDACVMESARLNSHVFAMNRKPKTRYATLGEYYVGDADSVALCQPLLMSLDPAQDLYKNPQKYNPDRFLEPNNESKETYDINTWGSGTHLCPGKMFAIWEIKIATALILTNFKINLVDKTLPPLNYFSPSAFSEREVFVTISKDEVERDANVNNELSEDLPFRSLQCDSYQVQHYKAGGWLIRNYIKNEDQESLYNYLVELSNGAIEQKEILVADLSIPYPFAFHNLVYTKKSNCESPEKWYEWAQTLWSFILRNKELMNFPVNKKMMFNSLYAQLFASGSKLALHKDQYVSWGISVNLGSSCEFVFDGNSIILNSGDVFVADFSQVFHEVKGVLKNTAPGWTQNSEMFGRERCSIQIREVVFNKDIEISTEEFKTMLKSYAVKG